MSRGKKFTEEDFCRVKLLDKKHPTLTSDELGKIAGFSSSTVRIVRMAQDIKQYREIMHQYKCGAKKVHVQQKIEHKEDMETPQNDLEKKKRNVCFFDYEKWFGEIRIVISALLQQYKPSVAEPMSVVLKSFMDFTMNFMTFFEEQYPINYLPQNVGEEILNAIRAVMPPTMKRRVET